MIVCHPLKLIFLKTKKAAGTSFEVALSRYCSTDCIITPISSEDEAIRYKMGFKGPRNYLCDDRIGTNHIMSPNFGVSGNFANHSSAAYARRHLGDALFLNYRRIAIHRDPLDVLISQYFYRMISTAKPQSFANWCAENKHNVLENYIIAPQRGGNCCDVLFNYKNLHQEITNCNLLPTEFLSTFKSLRLKGQLRSEESRDTLAFYAQHNIDTSEIYQLVEQA